MGHFSIFLLFACVLLAVNAQIRFDGQSGGSSNRFRPGGNSPNRRPGGGFSQGGRPGSFPQGGRPGGNRPVIGFPSGGGSPNAFPPHRGTPGFTSTAQNNQTPRPVSPTGGQKIEGCNCLSQSDCPPGFGSLKQSCFAEGGRNGICCIKQTVTVATRLGPQPSNRKISFSDNEVQSAMAVGAQETKKIEQERQQLRRLGKFVKRGQPARAHAFFFERSKRARQRHAAAKQMVMSVMSLADKQNLSPGEAFQGVTETRLRPTGQFSNVCAFDNVRCDPSAKYRSNDGTCNNLRNPLLGQSSTPFSRLVNPNYEDGIQAPRVMGVDRSPLPNARVISSTVLLDVDSPSSELSVNTMQFSQFVDHDLTLTPFADLDGEAIECCKDGEFVQPQPTECFTIALPVNDGFFARRGQKCINFVRSMLAPQIGCALGPAQQQNALTHYIDGSMIYGSNREEFDRVADPRTGFMKMSNNRLPPINTEIECEPRVEGAACFAGGDSRITEQPALTVVHTIWIREHNRIAKELFRINPNWTPQQVFAETRRIVIAEVQHIIYNEWLPIIIGPNLVSRLRIGALQSGFRKSYNPNVDPTISNEFATAAFRYGHSMIVGIFKLIGNNKRHSTVRLRETFNAPFVLMRDPSLVDGFVRSFLNQNNQNMDSFVTTEVSNHLFQTPETDFGMDLMSLNIQRGRDHGIGTYSQMRQLAGLGTARSFLDLKREISTDRIRRLQAAYRHVDDIDLFVGGLLEGPQDGVLGPTFSFIIGEQFKKLQEGDRFFYDHAGQAGSFTPAQLQEIRKVTDAKILCENSDGVVKAQPNAFKIPGRFNVEVPCRNLPTINLEAWRGERPGNTRQF